MLQLIQLMTIPDKFISLVEEMRRVENVDKSACEEKSKSMTLPQTSEKPL